MNLNSDEKVILIPISQIIDFPEHPYKVKDDNSMIELVSSIKERGLIHSVIIRPIEDGMYEMVSGHRRKRAFEIAGIEKIPARVKEMTRDEAILAMVDSNLQREEILPSEKAFAYRMRLEAMNRQGQRTDLTSVPSAQKSKTSREILGEQVGESQDQVRRYIRFELWGGVYLEGMGLYNTEYETDGTNNEMTLLCKVKHPLELEPIPQNAAYRESTEVITSFWLKNT